MSQFTFNEILIEDLKIERGFAIPTFSYHEINNLIIPGRHGAIPVSNRLRSREFTIPVILFFTDEEDLQAKKERVASQLITNTPQPLIFDIEPNRVLYAMFSGGLSLDERELNVAKGTLNVICHNPFRHALQPTITSIGTIDNQGTAETPCIITVSGITGNQFIIRHHEQNKECRIIWNFVPTHILVIDMNKRTITINGNMQMASFDWSTDMFNLNPGINTLSITGGTGTVEFRERWL